MTNRITDRRVDARYAIEDAIVDCLSTHGPQSVDDVVGKLPPVPSVAWRGRAIRIRSLRAGRIMEDLVDRGVLVSTGKGCTPVYFVKGGKING